MFREPSGPVSENGVPIARDGSMPVWRYGDKVKIKATWSEHHGRTVKVFDRFWEPNVGWHYRVRTPSGGTASIPGFELECVRHNARGGTETSGRKVRTYCTCGQHVGTDYDE